MAKKSKALKTKIKNIGDFMKLIRDEAGVTQKCLSREMGFTTAQYVSNVERGICPPSINYLRVLCDMTGCSPMRVSVFLGDEQQKYILNSLK